MSEISELIERLKDYKCSSLTCCNDKNAAADEIIRLRDVLEQIADDPNASGPNRWWRKLAREAL